MTSRTGDGGWTRLVQFLGELRRRKVYRVLIGYAVAGWVLIEVAETTFPYVGLPDRAVTAVIALVIVGFPVALVLGWVFDITPEGLQVTGPVNRDETEESGAGTGRRPAPIAALPTPPTPVVGREKELAQVQQLLTREGARLVTLLGPGGAGKTRLALEVAHRLEAHFADGALWVPLGSVRDSALVPSSVGRALGVGEESGRELTARIADVLGDRELLLVLDNFEQVVEAAERVAELLRTCPRLHVLTTSRAPLRLKGEKEFLILPLAAPDPRRPTTELMASPAVRLFAERARDVNPSFELTDSNVGQVAAICRRLDGLPLALELVAARAKVLTPASILSRLETSVTVLERGARDHAPHQRTLRDTIAWSHELLSPEERVLFRRLAVFAGGAHLEAIQAVAATDLDGDVVDPLHSLVDQSLVLPASVGEGDLRFGMLEVIREYAAEKLGESEDEYATRRRHAEHFTGLARKAEPKLAGPDQAEWLARLEEEHDNFRAALGWLRAANPRGALELAVLLWKFWEFRGHLTEGRGHLEALLDQEEARTDEKLQLKALYATGVLADSQGDYEGARSRFEETLAINREADNPWGIANSINNLGVTALRHGDYDEAVRLYVESVSLWQDLGNDSAVALALDNLGSAARLKGDCEQARTALEASLALHRKSGEPNGCGLTLGLLAEVARDEGSPARARELFEESLALFRDTGNRPQIARSLLELATLDQDGDRWEDARRRLMEALTEYETIGSPRGLAEVFEKLAALAVHEGCSEECARFAEVSAALKRQGQAFDPGAAIAEARKWASSLPN